MVSTHVQDLLIVMVVTGVLSLYIKQVIDKALKKTITKMTLAIIVN